MALNYFGIEELIPLDNEDQTIPTPTVKKALRDYYQRNDRFMIPIYNGDGDETLNKTTLKGFSFKKEDLLGILKVSDADRVMFAFGYHDGTLSKKGFTMIMIGVDVNEIDGTYELLLDEDKYDFCEPCPTKCTTPDLYNLI